MSFNSLCYNAGVTRMLTITPPLPLLSADFFFGDNHSFNETLFDEVRDLEQRPQLKYLLFLLPAHHL